MLLHTEPFAHRSFYTQKLLLTDTFTHRTCCTQTLLHTEAAHQTPLGPPLYGRRACRRQLNNIAIWRVFRYTIFVFRRTHKSYEYWCLYSSLYPIVILLPLMFKSHSKITKSQWLKRCYILLMVFTPTKNTIFDHQKCENYPYVNDPHVITCWHVGASGGAPPDFTAVCLPSQNTYVYT